MAREAWWIFLVSRTSKETAMTPEPRPISPEIASDPRLADDIRLDQLSATEWRVIDRRLREQDAPYVIGFVEKLDNEYETLVFGNGCMRWKCRDLNEALALFCTHN